MLWIVFRCVTERIIRVTERRFFADFSKDLTGRMG